jgi:hypothetical protein
MQFADLCCFIFDQSLVDVLDCLGPMQLQHLPFRFLPVRKDREHSNLWMRKTLFVIPKQSS